MGSMKALKPLIVIVLAVAVAAGAAVYLSRQPDQPAEASTDALPEHAAEGVLKKPEGIHFRGPGTAKVTLVEFGDYQCPSCGAYHPLVKELLSRYPKDLRLEWHHYPLISIHPNAMAAAMAVEAAGEQGRYWEMHDLIFENQPQWAERPNPEPDFLSYASRIGLNQNAFMQATRSPALQDRVLKDVIAAREAKLEGVPTFFIDGKRLEHKYSIDYFVQTIDEHLHAGK